MAQVSTPGGTRLADRLAAGLGPRRWFRGLRSPSRGPRGLADLALAVAVVGIVAMMVVPLPAALLDVLLVGNLALALVLLLVALQVADALAVAAFPTVLLVTTLYRLALDVAATRLILGRGDGGAVIRAFGHALVRGNYVVGGVVFAILSLVQYLVIARGSARVAEVAARFALDALPGRQLAIDAELRAGGIDAPEATRRRHALARESQFCGAMDGAMKFVKGDAIAGVVVVIVNLLGGFAIGVGQRGMDLGTSLRHYGLLSIGQGLVAQIPALVIATAAGILVTRVATEDPAASLGAQLASQLASQPRALALAAGCLGLLALVPALPAAPFLALATLLALAARWLPRADVPARAPHSDARDAPALAEIVPLALDLGPAHHTLVSPGNGVLEPRLTRLRETLYRELGVALPAIHVAVDPGSAHPDSVVVRVHEIPVCTQRVAPTPGTAETTTDADAVVVFVAEALRRRAGDFLGIEETQRLLDGLAAVAPALVRNVVPRPVSVVLLAEILRALVAEGVGVRNLRAVLEALAQRAGAGASVSQNNASAPPEAAVLGECVRVALRREITFRHAPTGCLRPWLLAPEIEDALRDGIQRTAGGALLALDPVIRGDILQAVRAALGTEHSAVVLTQPDVRRFVRALLVEDFPDVAVMAHPEVEPGVRVEPLGRIRV